MKKSHTFSWILQLFTAGMLIYAGLIKITCQPIEIELFNTLEMEPHGRYIIGTLELIAASLILIPPSIIYGAILAWGIMVGAIIAHTTVIGYQGSNGILMLLAIATLTATTIILYIHRHTSSLLAKILHHS